MKFTLPSLALLLLAQTAIAQCVISPIGAPDPAPPIDNWQTGSLPIGFAFPFNGATYTHFYHSDHGLIALNNAGVPAVPGGGAQVWTPGAAGLATFAADVICAYWGDHTVSGGALHIDNTSGSHCTITWFDCEPYAGFTAGAFTAQVTLFPSGEIRINLDNRCNNTSSTYGAVETVIGVHQDGNPVPASSDLSAGAVTADATCFELFIGPGPTTVNTPDPNFDLGDTTLTFIPTSPGWIVIASSPVACADSTSVGTGCGGLSLAASSPPVLGGSWDLDLSGITAPAPVPNFLAFGNATPPTPLGVILPGLFAVGCTGHMDLAFGLVDIGPAAAGVASMQLTIPADTALTGYSLTAQGLAINLANGMLFISNGQIGTLGH